MDRWNADLCPPLFLYLIFITSFIESDDDASIVSHLDSPIYRHLQRSRVRGLRGVVALLLGRVLISPNLFFKESNRE